MTLLIDNKSSSPHTHVLLIGIGSYPYLKGGTQKKKLFAHHENMGQLDSPPHSARRLADWFANEFRNSLPLGSLAMLVSGGRREYLIGATKHTLEPATTANAKAAIGGWADRCDRNADNLALFYFCGHGVASGQEQSLLLQDFGSDVNSPFQDAIAFAKFRTGMRRRAVKRQCFFIDACRSVSEEYLLTYGADFTGLPMISGGPTSAIPGTQSQAFFASELGTAAYGVHGKASIFTQGLLAALNGLGASEDEFGAWAVGTNRLAEAVNAHALTQLVTTLPEQMCVPDGVARTIPLHQLNGIPRVPVLVRCDPPAATPHADFRCLLRGQKEVAKGGAGTLPVWQTELLADQYDFRALFPSNPKPFQDGSVAGRSVQPPIARVAIPTPV